MQSLRIRRKREKDKVAELSRRFNNGSTPLIMAYIGEDDPMRGDSRGAAGIAKRVAEAMGGRYVYLDKAILKEAFPNAPDVRDCLENFLSRNGCPDIVIGIEARNVEKVAYKKPRLIFNSINESLSEEMSLQSDLVSHHLSADFLHREKLKFKQYYPDIKGPLIAITMGGAIYTDNLKELASKLADVCRAYDKATLFICPSRRTGREGNELEQFLKQNLSLRSPAEAAEYLASTDLTELFETAVCDRPHYNQHDVICVSFDECQTGYNPYPGLLACADHIVVVGNSQSLVSEALYMAKNIYVHLPYYDYNTLKEKNYISNVTDLEGRKPFPTREIPLIDITSSIAKGIVATYNRLPRRWDY